MRSYRLLALALIAALVVPLGAGTPALAAGIQPVSNTSAGARALAAAMVADPATLVDARFAAVPAAGTPHGVADHLSFFPTAGPSFGILTTGDAGLADDENAQPNAGADLQGPALPARGATALDVTTLAIDLRAPDGANCVRFDFAFYSEEFPEYVGQRFNDAFIAELNKTTWTASSAISAPDNFAFDDRSAEVSVNSSGSRCRWRAPRSTATPWAASQP